MPDPVLIVGAGPTGLTAALELSRLSVPVRLVDKRAAPATTSRAIGVQARTLELFDQRGLAEELLSLGNPARFGSVYGGGKRLVHLDFAHVDSRYPFILFVSQADTERVLREACARTGVAPEWRTELVGIQQDAMTHGGPAVSAVLRRPDGALEQVAASWLIGAEGAHSLIRATLDLPFDGHTRHERYALGDLLIEGALPDTDFHIFSSPHGFLGLFPMGGPHFRLIASTLSETPAAGDAPTLDDLQGFYDQRSHIPARFHDLTWSSWFTINSRMVSRLRIGRMFLGGDAAHIHSPAGAQGMNTGIQDMINLCWKLAAVMRDGAPAALLDSYEADRLPVMRHVLSRTDGLTTTIGTENPLVRSLFNHLGPWIGGAGIVQTDATSTMSQVSLGYGGASLSENAHPPGTLRGGDRVPDLPVRRRAAEGWSATQLHRLLDPSHPTLLVATQDGTPAPRELADTLPAERLAEIMPAGPAEQHRFTALFGRAGSAVLARPDGYAAVVAALPSAAAAMRGWLGKWSGSPAG
ncbi:FAD-dependent monooxygenase [Rhizosaccharibacter radicis]|uniref:FAD-dependent monooxygenase n=1 Tax=Rhizosaccharibacter radicis TaxID=2782605 RepID=A0ABT1VTN8_9PROT|nr:FAD-dependent monooxygenase [Acetobacteraceae bacterium KSS12]